MFNIFKRKNYKFEINTIDRILYLKIYGETFSNDIISINKKIIENKTTISGYNWIVDIRKSKQLFELNQIDSMFSFFKTNADILQNVKIAILIGSIKHAIVIDAISGFFKKNNIEVSIKKAVDYKDATKWLSAE